MSFLTSFEITISQLGVWEDVGLWQSRKPTSPPLESNVNICHPEFPPNSIWNKEKMTRKAYLCPSLHSLAVLPNSVFYLFLSMVPKD